MRAAVKNKGLMVLAVVMMVVWNAFMIPFFVYAAFGSDMVPRTNTFQWITALLLAAWFFLCAPNFPLIGILLSLRKNRRMMVYSHLGLFLGTVLGLFLFLQTESSALVTPGLVVMQVFGVLSLILLGLQIFFHKPKKYQRK